MIRDADGHVAAAGRGCLDHLMGSLQSEIIACLQGAQAAADLGIARIILETDAMLVRNTFYSRVLLMTKKGSKPIRLRQPVWQNTSRSNRL